jgi:predicted nucleic acid-binding protein
MKSMTEPVFVDTNVWVYAVDAADPDKRARALAVTTSGPDRQIVISTQVLTEFYSVVTRKLGRPARFRGLHLGCPDTLGSGGGGLQSRS